MFASQFKGDRSAAVITIWHKWITDAKASLNLSKIIVEKGVLNCPEMGELIEVSRRTG